MITDPSATLSAIRERWAVVAAANLNPDAFGGGPYAAVVRLAQEDTPVLVAALEAVLKHHVHAVNEDMPDPFHYCKTCSGHPAWPCPEVRDITTALTGEERSDGA